MVTQDDYFASLTEEQVYALERLYEKFQAAHRLDDGPEKERLLQAVDREAQGLDSAEVMAASRSMQVLSMLDRDAYAEAFAVFVPTMDLIAERGDEISDHIRIPLETLVVGVVGTMMDDPEVPRSTIESFLDQLEREARSGRAAEANLALSRALWHAHTGEREVFEGWLDRWATSGSAWWRQDKSTSIMLTSTMLGSFDPLDALEHLLRRTPSLIGDEEDRRKAALSLAGWFTICGDPVAGWERCRAVLTDPTTPDLATLAEEAYLDLFVRSVEAAPDTSDDPRIPDPGAIAAAAAEELDQDSTDLVEGGAALARHHLRRGDAAEGRRWRALAEERAAAFDRRNGTGHQSSLLAARWFHDL